MNAGDHHRSTSTDIKSLPDQISPSASPRPAEFQWRVRGRTIRITRPYVIGILNITPDSFSDGGRFDKLEPAMAQVHAMVEEGADGIDVGGESTRPQGASAVSLEEELQRVVPVLSAIRAAYPELLLSIDTTKADVANAALNAGVDIINDVSGFRIDPRVGEIAAARHAAVILMHSRGGVTEMGTYRYAEYGSDVVGEVIGELTEAIDRAIATGVARDAIAIDPGFGFAKRSEHSLRVLAELDRVCALGFPVMVGVSRKRFVGELSRVHTPADRIAGTVGANVAALMNGARLFRVHDVAPNRQALDVAWGILQAGQVTRGERDVNAFDSRFPIPDSR